MTATNILIVFAGLLISAIGAYFCFFRSPLTATKAEIEDLNRYLKEVKSMADASGNARRFYVEHFEDISKEFYKHDSVKPIWIDFRKSLTRHKTDEVEELYSASDAADYFSFHNFTRGLSMPFWNGYGGVFTGLGILGTFVGLTVGLNNIDMSSADIEVLKGGIASLLSGVQSAFYTSLVGIGIAIIYGPLHNRVVNGFKEEVRNLASMVEEMIQRCTAEEWLHKNYVESAAQTLALKNIGTDVADAIYDGFDKHFNEGVSRLCDQIEKRIAPFFEGIETAINNLNDGFGDAVGRAMSEQAGKQMQRFAQALDDFAVSLKQTMESSQQLSIEMNSSILLTLEELHRTLKAVAEEAAAHQRETMKENADVVNRLLESMSTFTEQQEKTLAQSAENNAEQMKLATILFQKSLTEHMNQTLTNSQRLTDELNEKILSTVEEMRRTLKEGAEDTVAHQRESVKENAGIVDRLVESMSAFTERQEKTLAQSAEENAEQMKLATMLFQKSLTEHMNQTLTNSQRLTDELNVKILNTVEEMRRTLKEGAEDAVAHQRESVKENAGVVDRLVESMSAFTERQEKTLAQSAEENAEQMKLATMFFQKSLTEHINQTLTNSQRLTDELNVKILNTIEEMRRTLKEGAEDAAAHQRAVLKENAEQMKSAADLFKATIEKYNDSLTQNCDKITNMLKGAEDFLLYVDEATTAIKDAAEPVQQSALTLKNYLEQLDQATRHLHDEISAQLSTLTEANNRSEKNIFLLTAGLQEYEKNIEQAWANYESNFNRVGGELEKSTDLITDRLQKYNEMMNGGMTKALTDFDKSVSGAVGSLQALVEDLQDTIDDLKKERRLD